MNEKEREAFRQKYHRSLLEKYGKEFADKWLRKNLEESLAGYETLLDKQVHEEAEQLFETVKETVFAMVRENYGIEFVEDPDGQIIFENEEIFNFLIPLLKQLSSILSHPESTHVSVELTKDENDEWKIEIVNRAE